MANLGSKAVAYFNVDCAVQGPGFFVSSTPQLDELLIQVMKKVKDPDSENSFLYDQWVAANNGINIQRLSRVDSDFAPFLQHLGIPSIDIYFGSDFQVYHTAFDSYDWMANIGDPSFHRHVSVANVWGLVAIRLADEMILPFNYVSYAAELLEYQNVLSNLLEGTTLSLQPIAAAIQEFLDASKETLELSQKLQVLENLGEFSVLKRRILNDRLMLAERGFLDSDGLHGLPWFKHLVYGPRDDSKSKIAFFPGIADAISSNIEEERIAALRHEIWRVARAIQRAAFALRGDLT